MPFPQWFDEKFDLYKDNHPIAAGMTIENAMTLAESYFIPYHEGAVRYLKELGAWTPAAEARQKFNVETLDGYVNAWQAALLDADSKGIEVNPKNKEWIELWYSYKDTIPNLSKLRFTDTSVE